MRSTFGRFQHIFRKILNIHDLVVGHWTLSDGKTNWNHENKCCYVENSLLSHCKSEKSCQITKWCNFLTFTGNRIRKKTDEKTTLFHGGICNDCDVAWCFWKNASWDTIRSSSAITYTNHSEIAKFNKYQYLFDPVACFLKSGNRGFYISFCTRNRNYSTCNQIAGTPVISKWI